MEIVESIDLPTLNLTGLNWWLGGGPGGDEPLTVPIDWTYSGFPAVTWNDDYAWIVGSYYNANYDTGYYNVIAELSFLAKVDLSTKSIVSTVALPKTRISAFPSLTEAFGNIYYSSAANKQLFDPPDAQTMARIYDNSYIDIPTPTQGYFGISQPSLDYVHSLGTTISSSQWWDVKINKNTNNLLVHEINTSPNPPNASFLLTVTQTSDLYSNYYVYFGSENLVIAKHNSSDGGFEASWLIPAYGSNLVPPYLASYNVIPYIKYYDNYLYIVIFTPDLGLTILKIDRVNGSLVSHIQISENEINESIDDTYRPIHNSGSAGGPLGGPYARYINFDQSLPTAWIGLSNGIIVLDYISGEIVDYDKIGFYPIKINNNEAWVDRVVVGVYNTPIVQGSGDLNKIVASGFGWSVGSIG